MLRNVAAAERGWWCRADVPGMGFEPRGVSYIFVDGPRKRLGDGVVGSLAPMSHPSAFARRHLHSTLVAVVGDDDDAAGASLDGVCECLRAATNGAAAPLTPSWWSLSTPADDDESVGVVTPW